ncbi:hypothetical protein B841_09275 [Corynebacterium maris DSM 45190]|uniref:Heparan-alpha-glucosaminide N-acetyltransferase catalytic domain-containing protein n=2 Tax=Corynebacterium TaxID=1716 RepID=S5TKU3_9CORY|nr:hypothetical protein B841_09275 [Corynebacterium maris DSM 45190]
MIIVHSMPSRNPDTGGVSLLHQIFSGHAAPLFALLAGVSLALLTGGATAHDGRRLRCDRVMIMTRALVLLVFGMALNFMPLPVFSILPFYGIYFLMGILFVGARSYTLWLWAGSFALFGPFLAHAVGQSEAFESISAPTLVTAVSEPLDVIVSLVAVGYYPALTWMAYILLGMALGRMDLSRRRVHYLMMFGGALVAGVTVVISSLLVRWFDIPGRLLEQSWLTDAEITEILEFGGPLPIDSWWWMAVNGPHTNTPLSLLSTAAIAVSVLGVFLFLGTFAERALAFLAAPGSMTFTMYSAHLVLMAFAPVYSYPVFWTLLQITAAIIVGLAWSILFRQGPLERVISKTSKWAGHAAVPETPRRGDSKDRRKNSAVSKAPPGRGNRG